MSKRCQRNRLEHIDGLIVRTAAAGLELQTEDGAMPAGCNGPHQHRMTPARNTSHWAIAFLHAFEVSGRSEFARAAVNALDLLLSPALRPMGGAFWHRCQVGRNSFNGLIGQSWTIEALYFGWQILRDDEYRAVGLEVFSQHLYDHALGLWYQLDLDGSPLRIERTLNQQVWLAAMGARLGKDDQRITTMVADFLSRLPEKLSWRRRGLLPRAVLLGSSLQSRLRRLTRELLLEDAGKRNQVEVGYHLFTLTGLAQLFETMPDHEFWRETRFKKAVQLAFNPTFLDTLVANPYGFSYNVPGFELPYIYCVFRQFVPEERARDLCNECFSRQLEHHYDRDTHLLDRETADPNTLAARFYEICRIPRDFFSTGG